MKRVSVVAVGIFVLALDASARQEDKVAYPSQYRGWTHVRSTLIGPENPGFAANGGLHHYYANEKGVEGYKTGTFPDGAVLIDDLLETKGVSNPGVTIEGARRRVAVMVKDSQRFAKTGGWGFEIFKGDTEVGSLTNEGRAACSECHQKAKNGVYTQLRK